MASGGIQLQSFLRALEQGRWAGAIRLTLIAAGILALALLYLLVQFRGLSTQDGIDQAQVAREIAAGHGFSTKNYRPVEISLFQQAQSPSQGVVPEHLPEVYHAPFQPLVNAVALGAARSTWAMQVDIAHPVYAADRVIAATSMLFFLLSVLLTFRLAVRLFDQRIAVAAAVFILLADQFWQFSLSGLPQMLLLFLFSLALTCLEQALQTKNRDRLPYVSLALLGLIFGLMSLTQPLTLFVAIGAFIFCALHFRPRLYAATVPALGCLSLLSLWIWHNYQVSHLPFGLSPFAWLHDVINTESGWLRRPAPDLASITPNLFRRRIQASFIDQLQAMGTLLGGVLVAPIFFLTLLHRFRRPATDSFKWALGLMWAGTFVGTVLAGIETKWLDPNQIHLLFGPPMTLYGLAFVLIVLNRLYADPGVLRVLLLVGLGMISALPSLIGFLPGNPPVNFPPYLPSMLQNLQRWSKPNEVISSDMPWAVAWYGDRKGLWLPDKPATFGEYMDYQTLGGPIVMLYLTPLTRDLRYASQLLSGEYSNWAALVLGLDRSVEAFPLRSRVFLAGGQCLLLADRARWEESHR
ncbi:MAG: glycosyltransferase family 39 protein [Verrucomicrobia bacterium]|nr:glycosyltransferase family 39 protein [Verrucomicrobiota bacterium]